MFLHNSGSLCECELILACYFLWTTLQSSTPLSEISYQDILMDIVRMDNPTASIDQVPHSVVNVIRNFYSLLLDESSSLPYGRSLVFKNCQILGLFLKNHASFSVSPVSPFHGVETSYYHHRNWTSRPLFIPIRHRFCDLEQGHR